MRTRIKICGITRPEDAVLAGKLGADAIGLVFYPPSPRAVSVEQAVAVTRMLPPFVTSVALFVNAGARFIEDVLAVLPAGLLQFHGDESPQECARFGVPFIKAVSMGPGVDVGQYAERFHGAAGLLLDAWQPAKRGGTGETFDWSIIPGGLDMPLVLAGGLTPANVGEAVTRVRPFAVDVSSGVESSGGIKDRERLAAFVAAVRTADALETGDGVIGHASCE